MIAADAIMVIHLLWVVFMILGLPMGLLLRNALLRWLHAVGMAVTAALALVGAYCPLTTLEETLRWPSGAVPPAGGSFIVRVLAPVLYPDLDPLVVRWASVSWFLLTAFLMILMPPGKPLFLNRK